MEITEIVIKCEDKFKIKIDDYERMPFQTVGDLYHIIMRLLGDSPRNGCWTPQFFFRLRNAMVPVLHVPAERIRLDTPLEDLLPRKSRWRDWRRIDRIGGFSLRRLPLELPDLVMWWTAVVVGMPVGVGLPAFFVMKGLVPEESWRESALIVCSIAGLLVCPILVGVLLPPLLTRFTRSRLRTVGELVSFLVERQHGNASGIGSQWNSATVWSTLRSIVAEIVDTDPDRIMPDTRFWEDLNAG